MTVPFKKRRIVLPQHMEMSPEPATSSADASVASEQASSSSNKKSSLEAVLLVDTKLNYVKDMIKAQELLIARTTMQVFETCESQLQAELSIRSIRDLFLREAQEDKEERIETLSYTYVQQLQAVPKILKAMVQWKESLKFVSLATDVLKVLLFHCPKARKSFLQLGGTRILTEACQNHWFLPMTKAAMGALANVAPFFNGNHDVMVIEDCVSFVMKAMRVFDVDAEIQRLGTYFCLTLAASIAVRQRQNAEAVMPCTPEAVSSSSSSSSNSGLKRKLEPCH